MDLTSTAFSDEARIPLRHCWPSCGGANVSPDLAWSGAPAGTEGFAILCVDPDARTEGGWWHWAVVDIPAAVSGLAEGAAPPAGARELRNDFGATGWGGPCPPPGPAHRYVFTVYALDVPTLGLRAGSGKSAILSTITSHTVGQAALTGLFERAAR